MCCSWLAWYWRGVSLATFTVNSRGIKCDYKAPTNRFSKRRPDRVDRHVQKPIHNWGVGLVASWRCGSVGLAIKRSQVRVSAGHHGVKTLGKFLTQCASVTKQYNLVPVNGRLPCDWGVQTLWSVRGRQVKTVWSPCYTWVMSDFSLLSCLTACCVLCCWALWLDWY